MTGIRSGNRFCRQRGMFAQAINCLTAKRDCTLDRVEKTLPAASAVGSQISRLVYSRGMEFEV